MKNVTVNGVQHELSPDSPRATSHSALLQDIVTAVNALETGTTPDGIELSNADATLNVITAASDNTTTTSSQAAMTFHNTVAHATNDLEFQFTNSADTSLLKIDKEGDVTVAGVLTAAGVTSSAVVNSSATTAFAATGDGPNVITSATTNANATTSVAGLTFKNTVAKTQFDLEFDFQKSTGGSLMKIDTDGNVTTASGGSLAVSSNYLASDGLHTTRIVGAGGGDVTMSSKFYFATGASGTSGTATLVGGTVTVSTTKANTGSLIFVSRNTAGGTEGHLNAPVASIVDATSFVINSSSGTDTSTVNWWIIN